MRETQSRIADQKKIQRGHLPLDERAEELVVVRQTGLLARMGTAKCSAATHAQTLVGVTDSKVLRAEQSVLQLQRTHGNRYVQQVLTLAREAAPTRMPGDEKAITFTTEKDDAPVQRQGDSSGQNNQNGQAPPPQSAGGADGKDQRGIGNPQLCAGAESDYSGLDALDSSTGSDGQVASTVQRQDGGGQSEKARLGTTCVIPTSFSRFFQGTPPGTSSLAAFTKPSYTVQDGRIAIEQDRGASWVNNTQVTVDGVRSGATTTSVSACEANFDRGNTWYVWRPSGKCPAHDTLSSEKRANSKAECESVIGAGLDRDGAASAKLVLRHEQYHMHLACDIATEGNSRINGGATPADVRKAVIQADRTQQKAYDDGSAHGCNAQGQAAWEQRIDNLSSRWLP